MSNTPNTQADYNRKSLQKLGKKQMNFIFDAPMQALLDALCQHTGQRKIDVLRQSLAAYARETGCPHPNPPPHAGEGFANERLP